MNRPNVLFLIADEHNAKCLGAAGHPFVSTPNLDRLASQGVRFANAVTQSPICTPSRICYASGQYPHNHGYYANQGANPNGLPTLFGHFRRAGYGNDLACVPLSYVCCLFEIIFTFESVIDRTHKMTKTTVKFRHNPESQEAGIPSRG